MGLDVLSGWARTESSGRRAVRPQRLPGTTEESVAGKRITLLLGEDPFTARCSGSVRALALARSLRDAGHDVEFQVAGVGEEGLRLDDGFSVRRSPISPPWRNPISAYAAFNQPRSLIRVGENPPDLVVVSDSRAGPTAMLLGALGVRVVIDVPTIQEDVLRFTGGSGYDRYLIRPVERMALREPEGIIVASSRDRAIVMGRHAAHGPRVVVFPTPASPTSLQGDRDLGDVVLWVGRASGSANRKALRRLATSIIPSLLTHRPGTRVLLAGTGTSEFAKGDGVEAVEHYDSVDDLFVRARCLVAPLESETGSSMAVADALARSVPVVATPEAVVGHGDLGVEGQRIGDSDREIVDHLIALCDSPRVATRLGQAGGCAYHDRRVPELVAVPVRDLVQSAARAWLSPQRKIAALQALRGSWPSSPGEVSNFLAKRPRRWGRLVCGYWGDA